MTSTPAQRAVSLWGLAGRQIARDFRAGELRLLVVAVMLAVAALTAVGFFADRINGGLARDARQMLGGDAIVASDQPTPAAFVARATELGLLSATTASFPSMGRAPDDKGGASRLVSLKAVSASYPLRGQLRVSQGADSAEERLARAPEAGTVWVDPALLDAWLLKVGDPLLVGDASEHRSFKRRLERPRRARSRLSVSLQAVTFALSIGTTDPFIVSPGRGRADFRPARHQSPARPGS